MGDVADYLDDHNPDDQSDRTELILVGIAATARLTGVGPRILVGGGIGRRDSALRAVDVVPVGSAPCSLRTGKRNRHALDDVDHISVEDGSDLRSTGAPYIQLVCAARVVIQVAVDGMR